MRTQRHRTWLDDARPCGAAAPWAGVGPLRGPGLRAAGFTLLEVLIAMALFFVAVVAILELVSLSLRGARSLQIGAPHAGMVATELSFKLASTNKVELGSYSGDFGELYPDSRYEYEILEVAWATNTLRQVHITVYQQIEHREVANSVLDLFLFLPNAAQPGLGAGGFNRGGAR